MIVNKNKSEKQIVIKKSQWDKIIELVNLVNRLENTGDILDKINFKIKAYDDFIGASLKLRSKLLETDKEKQEVRVKLGEVYKKGFWDGLNFVNDTWDFDYVKQEEYLVGNGRMKENYGWEKWDRDIEKKIGQNIKKSVVL